MIKDRLVSYFFLLWLFKIKQVDYTSRIEQLKQYLASGNTVSNPVPMGLKPGGMYPWLPYKYNILIEKYKAPEVKKKKSSIFGKKGKKN